MIEIEKNTLDIPIKKFFTKEVVTVNGNSSIMEIAKKIIHTGHRRIPITKNYGIFKRKKVIGIVTAMDILDAFLRQVSFDNKIENIMVRDFIFCYENDTLRDVIKRLQFSRRGGFPVLNKRNFIVGIITEKDIVNILSGKKIEKNIKNFMTHKPFYINKGSFLDSLKILVNTRYRKLPILDKDKSFVGLFSDRICLKTIVEEKNIRNLENVDRCIKNIEKIEETEPIEKAINFMIENNIGGIPIFRKNHLSGFLTERDIVEKIKTT